MATLRVLVIILVLVNLVLLASGMGWLGHGGGGEGDRLAQQIAADKVRVVADLPEPAPAPSVAPNPPPVTAAVTEPEKETAHASAATPSPAVVKTPAVAAAAQAAKAAAVPPPLPPAKPQPKPAPVPQACRVVPALPLPLAAKASGILKGFPAVKAEEKSINATPQDFWVHVPPQKDALAAAVRVEELKAAGIQELFIVREEGPRHNAISLGVYRSEKSANDFLAGIRKKGAADAVMTPRGGEAKKNITLHGPADAVESAISRMSAGIGELRVTACEDR